MAWEDWLAGRSIVKTAYPVLIALSGVLLAPLAVPLLSPENYIRYTAALHLEQPRIERKITGLGPLPQIYADQFGWDEMAASVARVYNALPKNVRARTAIFGQNYGEAGAIDFFGPKYGLPPAISGHQNYFLWGPRGFTGESLIVMDASIEDSVASRPLRTRAQGRRRHASLFDAVPAFRPVLLPGHKGRSREIVAEGEEMGLRAPARRW